MLQLSPFQLKTPLQIYLHDYIIFKQVKNLITPGRAGVTTACIFIIFTFSAAPVYVVNRLGSKFSFLKNKTLVGIVFTEDKEQVEMFTFAINNFFIPLCAFVIVAISTVILSVQLRRSTNWRNRTTKDAQVDRVSMRNLKVSKMVATMATLFIFCFAPITVIMLLVAFEPDMSLNGKNFNVSIVAGGFMYILESVNSSANIFIYNHMSTKYRDTLRMLFTGNKRNDN